MKRLVVLVAATVLSAALMIGGADSAQAATGTLRYKGDTFSYVAAQGGVEITGVSSKDGRITFPGSIGKKAVVGIHLTLPKALSAVDFRQATRLVHVEIEAPYLGARVDLAKNTRLSSLIFTSDSSKSTTVVLPKSLRTLQFWAGKRSGSKAPYITDLSRARGLTSVELRYWGTSTKRAWSLTGLGKLKNLLMLGIDGPVKKLDLSKNTRLSYLQLRFNTRLTSVDVRKNTRLSRLDLDLPALKKLDLSRNRALYALMLRSGKLTAVNLGAHPKLGVLELRNLPLTRVDLSRNPGLSLLSLDLPKVTSLDLRRATELQEIYLANLPLSSLDLRQNTRLTRLRIRNVPLPSLDLRQNTLLGDDLWSCDVGTIPVIR